MIRNIYSISVFLLVMATGMPNLSGQTSSEVNQRVALIIGNSNYEIGPLYNPENDARAMAKALRETGFEVLDYINLETQADMKKAIREFGDKIQNGGVGLFYYAGHGIQVDGKNYIIPVKAEMYKEEEVEYESVDVGFVMAQMENANNRMNIIILDACRNNPFARSWRSQSTGLAFINAPAGTLIAYATAPGSVASDGSGDNGLYTEQLLKQMTVPGLKIEDVFKNVRAGVMEKSNKQQTPWESSSLIGDFYFRYPGMDGTNSLTDAVTNRTDMLTTQAEVVTVEAEAVIALGPEGSDKANSELRNKTAKANWKVVNDKYFFYLNGADETQNCIATTVTVDADVLLHHTGSQTDYLLKDYWKIRDQELREATLLVSDDHSFWKTDGDNRYWFYHKGNDITTETRIAFCQDDKLVYHPTSKMYYRLFYFNTAVPHQLYQAYPMHSPNGTFWYADEKYYYFYYKGEQIAARTYHRWSGNDLILFDEQTKSVFKLADYYNKQGGNLVSSEILASPETDLKWFKKGNTYWIYRNGADIPLNANSVFSDNNLIVFDQTSQISYLLKDYQNLAENTFYPADILFSPSTAFWRRMGNTYYLFVRGELINTNVSTEFSGQDLEVFHSTTGTTWILSDYGILNDNTLRPATIKVQ